MGLLYRYFFISLPDMEASSTGASQMAHQVTSLVPSEDTGRSNSQSPIGTRSSSSIKTAILFDITINLTEHDNTGPMPKTFVAQVNMAMVIKELNDLRLALGKWVKNTQPQLCQIKG